MITINDFVFYPINAFFIFPKGSDGKPDTSKNADFWKITGLVPEVSNNGDPYFKVYTLFDKPDSFGFSFSDLEKIIKESKVLKVSGITSRDKNYNDTIRFSSVKILEQKFEIHVIK